MTDAACSLCGGDRHRYDEEKRAFVPCGCLAASRADARYREAGVAERFESETWRSFLDRHDVSNPRLLLEAAKDLRAGKQPERWPLVHGGSATARAAARALLLREACDGGLDGRDLDLPALIDAEFSPGRGDDVRRVGAVVLRIGSEPPHRWNRRVLEELLRVRWERKLFVAVFTERDPARLGPLYKSPQIDDHLARDFERVAVEEKRR